MGLGEVMPGELEWVKTGGGGVRHPPDFINISMGTVDIFFSEFRKKRGEGAVMGSRNE